MPTPSSHLVRLAMALTVSLGTVALGACSYSEPIGAIDCRLEFRNLDTDARRQRVKRIVEAHAVPGTLNARSTSNGYICEFRVSEFEQLDKMHPKLAYVWESTWFSKRRRRVLSRGMPVFAMAYEATDLAGAVETVVRFRVTPGARLFYKPEGEAERDITDRVDAGGRVRLPVQLRPGQTWIYARSRLGGVEKFIRVNVFTGEMQEIERRDYPR